MKARQLIHGASFSPTTLKTMANAFDQAWARIAPTFGTVPDEVEAARINLAEAMLSVTTDGDADVAAMKDRAIEELAKRYRPRARRE